MTDEEKLKEIEEHIDPKTYEQVEWLIARVKELESKCESIKWAGDLEKENEKLKESRDILHDNRDEWVTEGARLQKENTKLKAELEKYKGNLRLLVPNVVDDNRKLEAALKIADEALVEMSGYGQCVCKEDAVEARQKIKETLEEK